MRRIRTHAAVCEVPFAEQLVNESGRIDSTRSRGGLLADQREREKERKERNPGASSFLPPKVTHRSFFFVLESHCG